MSYTSILMRTGGVWRREDSSVASQYPAEFRFEREHKSKRWKERCVTHSAMHTFFRVMLYRLLSVLRKQVRSAGSLPSQDGAKHMQNAT